MVSCSYRSLALKFPSLIPTGFVLLYTVSQTGVHFSIALSVERSSGPSVLSVPVPDIFRPTAIPRSIPVLVRSLQSLRWAQLVLGWESAWEYWVLLAGIRLLRVVVSVISRGYCFLIILPSPVRPSRLHALINYIFNFLSLGGFYSILGVQGILGESRSLQIQGSKHNVIADI